MIARFVVRLLPGITVVLSRFIGRQRTRRLYTWVVRKLTRQGD
jgi:hypothetical protein